MTDVIDDAIAQRKLRPCAYVAVPALIPGKHLKNFLNDILRFSESQDPPTSEAVVYVKLVNGFVRVTIEALPR